MVKIVNNVVMRIMFSTGFPLLLLLTSFSKGEAKRVNVIMTNKLTFEPKKVTIYVGDTVEWENKSFLVHTVTADPSLATIEGSAALPPGAKPFNSGDIPPGGKFSHTFTKPGKYRYFCIPHEGAKMIGEIIVVDLKP